MAAIRRPRGRRAATRRGWILADVCSSVPPALLTEQCVRVAWRWLSPIAVFANRVSLRECCVTSLSVQLPRAPGALRRAALTCENRVVTRWAAPLCARLQCVASERARPCPPLCGHCARAGSASAALSVCRRRIVPALSSPSVRRSLLLLAGSAFVRRCPVGREWRFSDAWPSPSIVAFPVSGRTR